MADENELNETTETTTETSDTTNTTEDAPLTPAAETPRMTGEKAVDIALGAALLAAEAASRAVQQISEQAEKVRENAPSILQNMEEKGRPVRESLVSKLQGGTFAPQNVTPSTPPENAEDEITALEQRVRELEQEVSAPPPLMDDGNVFATAISSTASPIEAETPNSDFDTEVFGTVETPAETATYDLMPASDALADSDYAVSETEDEARAEGWETPSETADTTASEDKKGE